jgi:predicted O-methyltransferase YrrM
VYSRFQLALKYFKYFTTAANGRGHGIHSPFVYDFILNVLNRTKKPFAWKQAEQLRNSLLNNHQTVEVEDFGAGSFSQKTKTRKISDIARSAAKPRKYAQLLYRLVEHYSCRNIIELGTSLGISTTYMAFANSGARVITCEGSAAIANISRENFKLLQLHNITVLTGEFEQSLPTALAEMPLVDLFFIDGNHRLEPTLHYFNKILPHLHENSIVVFDDIHWSNEMETAWAQIKTHEAVSETIDVFFLGIAFFRKAQKAKQHFSIRY